MNVDWIDSELTKRGLPRKRLADAIEGMTETKLSLVMSGKRQLKATEADQIRRFFGYRLPDDPPRGRADLVTDRVGSLNEDQLRAVLLYLDALTGSRPEH